MLHGAPFMVAPISNTNAETVLLSECSIGTKQILLMNPFIQGLQTLWLIVFLY